MAHLLKMKNIQSLFFSCFCAEGQSLELKQVRSHALLGENEVENLH